MINPTWWAEVWWQGHGEGVNVLSVEHWDGVRRMRSGLLASSYSWTLDVYDEIGRCVLSEYTGGVVGGLMRPIDGEPITMQTPMQEGRWDCADPLASENVSYQKPAYWRVDAPPDSDLVAWIAHRDMNNVQSGCVVPYDLDPNPVSVAMRKRKRIWDEQRSRQGTGTARPR
jgi:hypothetical protein